jgi:hypothetical protein
MTRDIDYKLTDDQLISIGKKLRNDSLDGNPMVASFAASLIDEDYPLSKAMWDVLFKSYSDMELGKLFADWCRGRVYAKAGEWK